MERELVVVNSAKLYLYVLLEDKEPVELRLERKNSVNLIGSIYKGKVKKLVPYMNAAFVDIGEEREAFLPLKDVEEGCYKLEVGSELLLQLKRTAIKSKGAKVSCKITLPGKYLVLMPTVDYVSISSKIEPEEEKEKIKEYVKELLAPYNKENYGFIIRTQIQKATDKDIISDFILLKDKWEKISKLYRETQAPSLIHEDNLKVFSFLRDYAGEINKIITDDYKLSQQIEKYIKKNFPKKNIKVDYINGSKYSLLEIYNIDKLINRILSPYVWLNTGGYLVIEETEALVSIDVNSGSLRKYGSLEETALYTNLEAVKEIAKQIRLRDLGGIIIIDFIDMANEEHKNKLIEILKEEIKKDKQTIKIKSFTTLGLLELTRKKSDQSVIKQLSTICPKCKGKGYLKGSDIVLFEIEKKIEQLKPFYKLKIVVHPSLNEKLTGILKNLNILEMVEIELKKDLREDEYKLEKF